MLTLAKIENDELVIPGITRDNESVQKFRRLTQSVSKDALGNMTDDDAPDSGMFNTDFNS